MVTVGTTFPIHRERARHIVLAIGFAVTAAIGALADHHGIGAACNPIRAFEVAIANAGPSWRIFGRYFVGAVVGLAIGLVIPFSSVFVLPAAVLMAVPPQADLKA